MNHGYKWQTFIYKKVSQRSNFDAVNKMIWKCICSLGGIKHAHVISDRTELFIETVAQYSYIPLQHEIMHYVRNI